MGEQRADFFKRKREERRHTTDLSLVALPHDILLTWQPELEPVIRMGKCVLYPVSPPPVPRIKSKLALRACFLF